MNSTAKAVQERLKKLKSGSNKELDNKELAEKSENLIEIVENIRSGSYSKEIEKQICDIFIQEGFIQITMKFAEWRRKKTFNLEDKNSNLSKIYYSLMSCIAIFEKPEIVFRAFVEAGVFKLAMEELATEDFKTHMNSSNEESNTLNCVQNCFSPIFNANQYVSLTTLVAEKLREASFFQICAPYLDAKCAFITTGFL